MSISQELKALISDDNLPYLFLGGSEDEWFDALESGYFEIEYRKRERDTLCFFDMPLLVIPAPSSSRPINSLFNGVIE